MVFVLCFFSFVHSVFLLLLLLLLLLFCLYIRIQIIFQHLPTTNISLFFLAGRGRFLNIFILSFSSFPPVLPHLTLNLCSFLSGYLTSNHWFFSLHNTLWNVLKNKEPLKVEYFNSHIICSDWNQNSNSIKTLIDLIDRSNSICSR